jgi:hypothetical protein
MARQASALLAMNRLVVSLVLLMTIAGCASQRSPESPGAAEARVVAQFADIVPFSANPPGSVPRGWAPLVILRTKKPTHYELVQDGGKTVLHARAEASSSAMMHKMNADPNRYPWLSWRWKIEDLVEGADNTRRGTEDSPVRIVLGFDGDKETLSFADQVLFETAKVVTGHDFPYATLMYIWENRLPVGTVIRSPHSGRIRMMVVASGPEGVGQWRSFRRNIVADYEKAFGEKPGRLLGVGVLTDTDNTGDSVQAWYGDIRLSSGQSPE